MRIGRSLYDKVFRRIFIPSIVMLGVLIVYSVGMLIYHYDVYSKVYTDDAAYQISQILDSFFTRIGQSVDTYLSSNRLSMILKLLNTPNGVRAADIEEVKNEIYTFILFEPGMELTVTDASGEICMSVSSSLSNNSIDFEKNAEINEFVHSEETSAVLLNVYRSYYNDRNMPYIVFIRKIQDPGNKSRCIGYLMIEMRQTLFPSVIARQIDTPYKYYMLYSDGSIVTTNIDGYTGGALSGVSTYKSARTGIAVGVQRVSPTWWSDIQPFLIAFVGIFLVFWSVIMWLIRDSSKRVVTPIYRLIATMQRIDDNHLDVHAEYGEDILEIQAMYQSFNSLMMSLRKSIDENYRKDMLITQVRLNALMDKINPHFLYNALETISSQALIDSSPATSQMCQMLGTLFRYNLHTDESVELSQEISVTRDYVRLRNLSTSRRPCTYEVDDPDALSTIQFPKLALQPIIENALKHGLKNADYPGLIIVNLRREKDHIRLGVSDNGVGMTEDALAELRQRLNEADSLLTDDKHGGYGLRHAHVRLRLFYGAAYYIELASSPGNGMTVALHIPICQ